MRILNVLLLFIFPFALNAQWYPINIDTTILYNAVYFLNPDTGYVVGEDYFFSYDELIMRTTDGGQSWDTTRFPNGLFMMSIVSPTDSVAYTGGQDGGIYKTTDAGQTWNQISNLPGFINDFGELYFLDKDTGFALDFLGRMWKTNDGAVSWLQVYQPPDSTWHNAFPNNGKIQFVTDSIAFAANGDSGLVLKSVDRGNTWSAIPVGNPAMRVTSIHMINADTGYVVGKRGLISKTTNGGLSWSSPYQLTTTVSDLLDIVFFTDSIGYIVGGRDYYSMPPNAPYRGLIFRTYDGGNTWTRDDSVCCHWMTAVHSCNDSVGYAVGYGGRILKTGNAGFDMGINQPVAQSSSVTIYPNPFSATATVQIKNNAGNDCVFRLYDALGRKVKEIAITDEETILEKGDCLPGIYFWETVSGEQIIGSGKIIIE